MGELVQAMYRVADDLQRGIDHLSELLEGVEVRLRELSDAAEHPLETPEAP